MIAIASYQNLPVVIRDFLIYMETIKGKSEKTVHEYFLDLRMFFRFMKTLKCSSCENTIFDSISIDDITIDFIRQITLSDVYAFLNYIAKERPTHPNSPNTPIGLSSRSRARKISSLRAFFKYLTDKTHALEQNPVSNLDIPTIRKNLPSYLKLDDCMKLLQTVEGTFQERDYCILVLFLNCGLRVSELVALNLDSIQEDSLKVVGKGNKERVLYLNPACKDAIDAYLNVRLKPNDADKHALFISRNRNRINVQTVKWLVKKYLTAAGLDTTKLSTHKLRHTAATLMYQNGVDIRTLQTVLGHEQVNTTMIYTHIENQDVRNAVNQNPLSKVTHKKNSNNEKQNN